MSETNFNFFGDHTKVYHNCTFYGADHASGSHHSASLSWPVSDEQLAAQDVLKQYFIDLGELVRFLEDLHRCKSAHSVSFVIVHLVGNPHAPLVNNNLIVKREFLEPVLSFVPQDLKGRTVENFRSHINQRIKNYT